MAPAKKHNDIITGNFGPRASAYLTSATHSQGRDLERLAAIATGRPGAAVLDMGCGAGHVSYAVAPHAATVIAYDMSASMLGLVASTARERGFSNIGTCEGIAESLPFADASFDIVASRYSGHHWHDAGRAVREAARVLKPGGLFIVIDVASPGYPVLDIFLQTIEMLRDTSHVRDYTPGEWLGFIAEAGLRFGEMESFRLRHAFRPWIERIATPAPLALAVRELQKYASAEVAACFALEEDGSFSDDAIMLQAEKEMEM